MHDPRDSHLAALKRILRYVRGTLDYGLHVQHSSTANLVAYSDADWAGCPDTRKSTSGYAVFLGDNLVSWSSKRQHTVSRSSAEAEHKGLKQNFTWNFTFRLRGVGGRGWGWLVSYVFWYMPYVFISFLPILFL